MFHPHIIAIITLWSNWHHFQDHWYHSVSLHCEYTIWYLCPDLHRIHIGRNSLQVFMHNKQISPKRNMIDILSVIVYRAYNYNHDQVWASVWTIQVNYQPSDDLWPIIEVRIKEWTVNSKTQAVYMWLWQVCHNVSRSTLWYFCSCFHFRSFSYPLQRFYPSSCSQGGEVTIWWLKKIWFMTSIMKGVKFKALISYCTCTHNHSIMPDIDE